MRGGWCLWGAKTKPSARPSAVWSWIHSHLARVTVWLRCTSSDGSTTRPLNRFASALRCFQTTVQSSVGLSEFFMQRACMTKRLQPCKSSLRLQANQATRQRWGGLIRLGALTGPGNGTLSRRKKREQRETKKLHFGLQDSMPSWARKTKHSNG